MALSTKNTFSPVLLVVPEVAVDLNIPFLLLLLFDQLLNSWFSHRELLPVVALEVFA